MNNQRKSRVSTKPKRGTAHNIREAVIGFDDGGGMVFYYPEDVHMDADGKPELDSWHNIEQPSIPGEPEPILALWKHDSGFWIGEPREWEGEVEPTGFIAFTEKDARLLEEAAEPGDLITRFRKR